jgi:hypothetical protein
LAYLPLGIQKGAARLHVLANLKFASREYQDLQSDKNGHNLFLVTPWG